MIECGLAEQFLNGTYALGLFQSNFRFGFGIEKAIVALVDNLHWNVNQSHSYFLISLDMPVAFEKVVHSILIHQLEYLFSLLCPVQHKEFPLRENNLFGGIYPVEVHRPVLSHSYSSKYIWSHRMRLSGSSWLVVINMEMMPNSIYPSF